ncbi:class I SAM-dependent methyltransferase [Puniceibacterium sediminis]|uniref:Methyltransferase domain-containing protein n=1 Tax=Puniceibacterium sediminis TaxID=1608407 RepID=A0A238VHP2_9RHOB|nr:class I SAM-dependent methyltransferase [Puniceibacterium sediminis]SNR33627.1 Methyltransferase domain-containing protein [Puniceibacterium sediminis]
MVSVREQYDTYPYPERDPADEAHRLITGSPSHPLEIDHFLFQGRHDWSQPFRALVAGGGTGDGLIQLAQVLTSAGRPYEITYLDLSTTAREVAEARAKARGLTGITFVTGSLLDAPDHGQFDYIDCCGVLHHLPDPGAGFAALRSALAPGGGMGFMVYAPYGRSGVYPLQEAFGVLLGGMTAAARLEAARGLVEALPQGHPFRTNPNLSDHLQSDAGFYDLLLHSQDRAYDVADLSAVLADTGWALLSFATPALYDLGRIAPVPAGVDKVSAWGIAEKLHGTIKMHVGYAVPDDDVRAVACGRDRSLVPHLRGVGATALGRAVAQGKAVPVRMGQNATTLNLPANMGRALSAVDGRRSIAQIAALSGLDPIAFGAGWGQVEGELCDWGLMLYSGLGA